MGLTELVAGALLLAAGNVPQLQRRTGPPVYTPTCQESLTDVRQSLYRISEAEARLPIGRKAQDYYKARAVAVSKTPELNASAETCTTDNLRTLDILVSEWQYDYLIDQEAAYGKD